MVCFVDIMNLFWCRNYLVFLKPCWLNEWCWNFTPQPSKSEPHSEIHCISNGVCEHKIHSDLCFEVKWIQFAPESHMIWRKKGFSTDYKIWLIHIHETGTREASTDNQENPHNWGLTVLHLAEMRTLFHLQHEKS